MPITTFFDVRALNNVPTHYYDMSDNPYQRPCRARIGTQFSLSVRSLHRLPRSTLILRDRCIALQNVLNVPFPPRIFRRKRSLSLLLIHSHRRKWTMLDENAFAIPQDDPTVLPMPETQSQSGTRPTPAESEPATEPAPPSEPEPESSRPLRNDGTGDDRLTTEKKLDQKGT